MGVGLCRRISFDGLNLCSLISIIEQQDLIQKIQETGSYVFGTLPPAEHEPT